MQADKVKKVKDKIQYSMTNVITGRTKVFGIFGYPVEHTLSPAMHNSAFEYLGMDCCYLPFPVRPEDIGQAVASIRALSISGVNVTVPHKEAVIPFLDEVHKEAVFIGAVNTIVNKDGRLTGHNTDGRGFVRSLEDKGVDIAGKKVLVIGAGGSARAVSYYLSEKAAGLAICNRGAGRLTKLVADLAAVRSNVVTTGMPPGAAEYDIIVNATSLGLKPDDPMPLDPAALSKNMVVCDLIYRKTPLLAAAEAKGCTVIDGLGMLLYQGVLAFELWTSVPAPAEIMKKALFGCIS